jgi:hypothetical protein
VTGFEEETTQQGDLCLGVPRECRIVHSDSVAVVIRGGLQMRWFLMVGAAVAVAVAVGWLGYDAIKGDWCRWMSSVMADGSCVPGFIPIAGPLVGAAMGISVGVVVVAATLLSRRLGRRCR